MKQCVRAWGMTGCSLFLFVLAACNGGGSSSPGSTSTVSGTAATGAAIAGATISIKDAAGAVVTVTSGTDGTYSADVTGMTPPFLLKVDIGNGSFLYSVGAAAGTINLHPLTDLIIRTWYEVQGTTVDVAFLNPVAAPPPTEVELNVLVAVIENLVEKWIVAAGLDPDAFDLITTPFTADSSGFDGFLDTLAIDAANGTITVDTAAGLAVEQTTTLDLDADGDGTLGDISASTTIVEGGVTSTSFTSAYIPTTDAESAALTGVLATLSSMAATINTQGVNLVAADLLPYFAADYLGRGFNRDQEAASFASDLAGVTLNAFTIDHVLDFDAVNNVISIAGVVSVTQDGVTVDEIVDEEGEGLIFKQQGDGSWLFHGNQERARAQVSFITERRMMGTGTTCSSGCDGLYYALQVQVGAPAGAVASATISGLINGTVQTLSLTKNGSTFSDNGVLTEHFDLSDPSGWFYQVIPANFAPAGTVYTFVVTFADTTTETYTRVLGASTSEDFTLQAGVDASVGHSASATLGNPVTLSWNLPVSFPIASVEMHGFVRGEVTGVGCDVEGPMLASTATSGTITLPAICGGEAVIGGIGTYGFPSINIVVEGVNGEKTDIWYAFQ